MRENENSTVEKYSCHFHQKLALVKMKISENLHCEQEGFADFLPNGVNV